MRFALCLTAVTALLLPASALADPTTYTVDISFASASVLGTITTDGTQGAIDASNITAFNLDLTNGAASDTFTQADGDVSFNGFNGVLSAGSSAIQFDFYGPQSTLLFQDTSTGALLCFENQGGCDIDGDDILLQTSSDPSTAAGEYTTNRVIATTPEPSSFILLATGILTLCAATRRRPLSHA